MTCLKRSDSCSCTAAREVEGRVSWWRPMETEWASEVSCCDKWSSLAVGRESGSREGWVRFERCKREGWVREPWRCESRLKVETA